MRNFLIPILSTFVLGILTALPAFANCDGGDLLAQMDAPDRATLYEATNVHPFPEGNIWRAGKPGSVINVIGTFHLSDPRMAPMMAQITPLLDQSEGLFVEATLEDIAELERRMASDTSIMLISEGPGLIERLPEETWETLKAALEERNIPGFMATRMQPWFASMMLAMAPCVVQQMATDLDGIQNGLDRRIMSHAQDADIPTQRLEKVEDVINLLAGDPIEEQIIGLKLGMLVYDNDSDAQFSTMKHSYFRGEHRLLWEYSLSNARNHPNAPPELEALIDELEDALLIQRNLAWMEILLPEAVNGTYMVAVGAGHLSGEMGVLNLLKQRGYRLTRLD